MRILIGLARLTLLVPAASGKRLAEQQLSSPPVFNGAAAAGERLFAVQEDGPAVCLGKR
jgi:hypothetical protein